MSPLTLLLVLGLVIVAGVLAAAHQRRQEKEKPDGERTLPAVVAVGGVVGCLAIVSLILIAPHIPQPWVRAADYLLVAVAVFAIASGTRSFIRGA